MRYCDLSDLVTQTMAFERRADAYYRALAGRIRSEEGRIFLATVCGRLGERLERLARFRRELPAEGFVETVPDPELPQDGTDGALPHDELTTADLVRLAIDFEQRARDVYRDAAASAPTNEAREVFTALSNFEDRHVYALQRDLAYWTDGSRRG